MNFEAYKNVARGILASEQGARLLRLDCMNPVKALSAMRARLPTSLPRASVADLEAAWRTRWGLTDAEGSVRLSTGVRPLLAQLFGSFAESGRRVLAPEDVYPVYLQLAKEAGVALSTFPTVPHPALPPIGVDRRGEVLLVPEPLVPLGRGLNDLEVTHIQSWLEQDHERLLILDCVYTFSEGFTKAAEAFLAGGRTVLLHSLAKGFLAPDVAGFAIGPAAVIDKCVHQIGDEARTMAVHLLREASDLPQQLALEFSRRWSILNRTLDLPAPDIGYFAVVPTAFDTLLARGQLAVPGSVFGSVAGDWSAVTCLLADVSQGGQNVMNDTGDTTLLFRPVGEKELALIREAGYRAFPPRLPEQPIFYPVTNEDYAAQIARDWNTRDGGIGYVTRFRVRSSFLEPHPRRTVGASMHEEYWIPAEDLPDFNAALVGPIEVIAEFHG
jgi:hypothetical protein